jgi:hypothetical protein
MTDKSRVVIIKMFDKNGEWLSTHKLRSYALPSQVNLIYSNACLSFPEMKRYNVFIRVATYDYSFVVERLIINIK